MKAVILSAGQGSRLLPLTANLPKCLLPLDSLTLLEWQIHQLVRSGIDEIVVVVGFKAEAVDKTLAQQNIRGLTIRTLYNPFFQVADNLSTCWMTREEMREDFLLINGDTVFDSAIPAKLLAEAVEPVSIAMDRRASYDADDMKLSLDGHRLLAIGKWLPPDQAHGESIGMMLFRGAGPRLFTDELERIMRTPEGLDYWYTSVIDSLAKAGKVAAVSIQGLEWGEVDFPVDLQRARAMVARWTAAAQTRSPASR